MLGIPCTFWQLELGEACSGAKYSYTGNGFKIEELLKVVVTGLEGTELLHHSSTNIHLFEVYL